MSIEPFIKCRNISASLAFYTEVLDFTVVIPPDPDIQAFMSKYSLIEREGCLVHLSAHSGDGVFGSVNLIRVGDLDCLYEKFLSRGIKVSDPAVIPGVSMPPVEQTWGMKEFSVRDPDNNRLTFAQQIN